MTSIRKGEEEKETGNDIDEISEKNIIKSAPFGKAFKNIGNPLFSTFRTQVPAFSIFWEIHQIYIHHF